MKRLYISIWVLLLTCIHLYGQLNEFMIQSYVNDPSPGSNRTRYEVLCWELKEQYGFNTIQICRFADGDSIDIDVIYDAAKLWNLKIIAASTYLSGDQYGFSRELVQRDLEKYSGTNSIYKVLGYNVYDEPDLANINGEGLVPFMQAIEEKDSSIIRYANMLSVAVYSDKVYREEYLDRYIKTLNPNLLSFDHYPIADGNDCFFMSLYDIALKSVEHSIPFISVVSPFKTHTDFYVQPSQENVIPIGKSIAEFYYVIHAALIYGAKGIAYWPGLEEVWKAIQIGVKENGQPIYRRKDCELQYSVNVLNQLGLLHKKLQRNSDVLLSLNFASAYHASTVPTFELNSEITERYEKIHEFSVWNSGTNDSFANDKLAKSIFVDTTNPFYTNDSIPQNLVISFLTNEKGQIYYWLFNKSLTSNLSVKLNTQNNIKDVLNGGNFVAGATMTLSPGEARLFTPDLNSERIVTTIQNMTYYADSYDYGFHPLEYSYAFTIGPSTTSPYVVFQSGVTKTFNAKELTIRSMDAKAGSNITFTSNVNMNTKPMGASRINVYSKAEGIMDMSQELMENSEVYVYPNPTNENFIYLYVESLEEEIEVRMYDMVGKIIQIVKTSNPETLISLENTHPGIYFLNFNKGEQIHNIKIVKR